MQIDFHFATTYVIARIAGFNQNDAEIIAYSSQYVDDSTTTGFLRFDNGMRYYREATAHPVLHLINLSNDSSAKSWLPFHFLPGNEQQQQVAPDSHLFERHLICRPSSPIAQEMMASVIAMKDRPHALHRLGIASHVFVDTFAHQGFIGQRTALNRASKIKEASQRALSGKKAPKVGHALVDTYPDRPYLRWQYTNADGEVVNRNNPEDFTQAADELCEHYQRYLIGDPQAKVNGLGEYKDLLYKIFCEIKEPDGDKRLETWIDLIRGNQFCFGSEKLSYIGKGKGSWKHLALGDDYLHWATQFEERVARKRSYSLGGRLVVQLIHIGQRFLLWVSQWINTEAHTYKYRSEFITSNYKLFHDAAMDQRHDLFTKIFPKFGIYAG